MVNIRRGKTPLGRGRHICVMYPSSLVSIQVIPASILILMYYVIVLFRRRQPVPNREWPSQHEHLRSTENAQKVVVVERDNSLHLGVCRRMLHRRGRGFWRLRAEVLMHCFVRCLGRHLGVVMQEARRDRLQGAGMSFPAT